MNLTDPIADMLARIRNAIMVSKKEVLIPYSKIKFEIAKIMKNEGYISKVIIKDSDFPQMLLLTLKYISKNKSVIEGIKKVSKPGRRVYANVNNMPKVLGGLGVSVISTSKGILVNKECVKQNVGGEILLNLW